MTGWIWIARGLRRASTARWMIVDKTASHAADRTVGRLDARTLVLRLFPVRPARPELRVGHGHGRSWSPRSRPSRWRGYVSVGSSRANIRFQVPSVGTRRLISGPAATGSRFCGSRHGTALVTEDDALHRLRVIPPRSAPADTVAISSASRAAIEQQALPGRAAPRDHSPQRGTQTT